jgi:hypothetical protein
MRGSSIYVQVGDPALCCSELDYSIHRNCKDTTDLLEYWTRHISYGLRLYASTSGLGSESLLDLTLFSFALILRLLD